MKKRMAALITAALLLLLPLLTGCEKTVSYKDDLAAYGKTMEWREGFTILQLTDIHWDSGAQLGENGAFGSERYLKKVIDEVKTHAGQIDLIEVSGDTFMLSDAKAVREFINFMAEVGIPYAVTWGNHDTEGLYNTNWFSKAFRDAPLSLYTEIDHDDIHGRSNYFIDLRDDKGRTVWQLFQLDSGASYRASATDLFLGYDWIREDQLEWLTACHEENVPSLCYYHIAQAECQELWDAVEAGENYKAKFFKRESFGASDNALSTVETFAKNNVKGVFMGHAHSADWTCTSPEGIVYGLGVKSSPELYSANIEAGSTDGGFEVTEDFGLTGASLVTLTGTDGSFRLEHLYLNERDEGDFVMWVEY